MSNPDNFSGHPPHVGYTDNPQCGLCGTEMEHTDDDCDPDTGKSWRVYTCLNPDCEVNDESP